MEKDNCLLCGSPASGPFSKDPCDTKTGGGRKYDCKICGGYALCAYEHSYLEHPTYCTKEQRLQLSEYIKDHPDKEGNYKILTMEEIRQVLHLPNKPRS